MHIVVAGFLLAGRLLPAMKRFARFRISNLAGFLICVLCISTGCATHVYPPASPPNPTTIYLCDYGIHSSLLLPTRGGQFVEYVYGDWDFAALNKTDALHTFIALFGSFQPTLGRRFLQTGAGETFPWPPNKPHTVTPINVSQPLEQQLVHEMDGRFRKHIDTALLNDSDNYYFLFVHDDERYGVFNNCNRMSYNKLKQLGCQVLGFPILSNFIVMPLGEPVRTVLPDIKPGRPRNY